MVWFFAFYFYYLPVGVLFGATETPKILSLEDYTDLVRTKNLKMRALNSRIESQHLESSQASLLTTSKAFTDVSHNVDKSPVLTPEFSGNVRRYDEQRAGVERQWGFGVKNRVYGLREEQRAEGVSALSNPNLSFTRMAVGVDAELPMMRNGFGRAVKHEREKLEAVSKSEVKNSEAQKLEVLIKAQNTYIDVAQMESSLAVQKDLIAQGERLVSWVRGQVRDRLLESVHLAEAEGALQDRRLKLSTKELKWQSSVQQLAQWIQVHESELTSNISFDPLEALERKINRPQSFTQRKDLEGKTYALQAERSRLVLEREQFRPDLNLKAKYLSYQKTSDIADSLRCSGLTQCHHYNVTLQFSVPLDFSTLGKGKSAIKERVNSLEFDLESEKRAAQTQFENLNQQSLTYDKQIEVLKNLIQSRQTRLTQERIRQKRGRSSTFDLIRAEQELTESLDLLLEARARRLQVFSQLRFFEEQP